MKNKIIIILLLIVLFPFIIKAKSYISGDVNGDNKVSALDYILIKKHILHTTSLNTSQLEMADVNNDKSINSHDYIIIKKLILDNKIIKKERIKIGTMNIASYDCGTGAGGAKCITNNNTLAKLYKDNNLDIIGIQEGTNKKFSSKDYGVKELASLLNYKYRFVAPYQLNATLTHYNFKSISKEESNITLKKCGEDRAIIKSIININNVDISFYTTHFSWQKGCPETHLEDTAKILIKDPNPIIIVGDFNLESVDSFNNYLKNNGFTVAAYDTNYHSEGKNSYLDSIWVKSNGHIDIIKNETIHTHNVISDHNLIVATVDIY